MHRTKPVIQLGKYPSKSWTINSNKLSHAHLLQECHLSKYPVGLLQTSVKKDCPQNGFHAVPRNARGALLSEVCLRVLHQEVFQLQPEGQLPQVLVLHYQLSLLGQLPRAVVRVVAIEMVAGINNKTRQRGKKGIKGISV